MLNLSKTTENKAATNCLNESNRVEKHVVAEDQFVKTSFFMKSSLLEQAKAKAKEEELSLKQYFTKLVKQDLNLL